MHVYAITCTCTSIYMYMNEFALEYLQVHAVYCVIVRPSRPYCCLSINKVLYSFWWGWRRENFVGHCHSVMHEYETTQIFKF